MIYLDNAATTYPKPEQVYTAMDKANRSMAFNAGRGSYAVARAATEIIDSGRQKMSSLLGADRCADVIFTTSVTQAMNQVLQGLELPPQSVVYISPYEHNAVARTIHALSLTNDIIIKQLPLTSDLRIDVDKAKFMFYSQPPRAVVMNAISNVTGYVLPVADIFTEAKNFDAITILDGAQAAGLIPLDINKLHADIICFAGHKTLCGPFGVAGFAIRRSITVKPTFTGGTGSDSLNLEMPEIAPARYEASSPNVVAISGLLAALDTLDIDAHYQKVHDLTSYLLSGLALIPNVRVLGAYTPGDTIGIISLIVDGYLSDEVGSILDQEFGIAVRTGYHCAPFIHEYLCDLSSNGTVRISVGQFNTKADIDALLAALESL